MPDTKITALAAITTVAPANDLFAIVDVSDNSMAASGTTKNITTNQILGAGGTATLATATITGDLTVDTSTLKVDSTNDRVGVGTASPAAGAKLGVTGATVVSTSDYVGSSTWAARFTGSSNGASSGISFLTNSAAGQPTPASIHATPIADFRSALTATYSADNTGAGYFAVNRFNPSGSNTLEHYKIDNAGVATWSNVGGVSSTAMTLNSTGLGVGYGPSGSADKLGSAATLGVIATGATADVNFRNSSFTAIQRIRMTDGTGTLTIGAASSVAYPVELGGSTSGRAVTIDASSNVGVGVTSPAQKLTVLTNIGISATTAAAADDRLIFTENMASANLGSQIVWKALSGFAYASIGITNGAAGNNGSLIFSTTSSIFGSNNVERMRIDSAGNLILQSSATPATLGTNGMLTVNATSNTNLRFSYRGSDGTTRVANITLA